GPLEEAEGIRVVALFQFRLAVHAVAQVRVATEEAAAEQQRVLGRVGGGGVLACGLGGKDGEGAENGQGNHASQEGALHWGIHTCEGATIVAAPPENPTPPLVIRPRGRKAAGAAGRLEGVNPPARVPRPSPRRRCAGRRSRAWWCTA